MYSFLALCLKKYQKTFLAKQFIENFRVSPNNLPLSSLIIFDSGVVLCCMYYMNCFVRQFDPKRIMILIMFCCKSVCSGVPKEYTLNDCFLLFQLFSDWSFIYFFRSVYCSSLLLWIVFSFLYLTYLEVSM